MELKTIVLGDEAVQILAEDSAKVEAFKLAATQKLEDSETAVGELTAKIADLESKIVADAEIDARVEAKMQLLYLARGVFEGLVADGKSEDEIRREVVAHKFGDAAIEGMSDAAIAGMFKVATMQGNDTVRKALADNSAQVGDYAKRMADASKNFLKGSK